MPGKEAGDETANWKTYTNNQYGFKIKYPKDWDVKDWPEANVPTLSSTQFPGVMIEIVELELPELPSTKLLEEGSPRIGIISESEKNIEIDELKARQWDTNIPGIVTFIERGSGSIFSIELYNFKDLDVERIYNRMLSTFRFIRLEEVKDETTNWKTYRNEAYDFEMKYPQDWDYAIIEIPNNPIMFAPQDIIIKVKQSIANIESDKSFTLWLTVYDKTLFEGGILPYRGKSNEYIKVISSDVDVNGVKGNYYISEYLKDKGGYKVGEKTITVDLPIRDGYLSMNLFDYQYVNIFEKMLSTLDF